MVTEERLKRLLSQVTYGVWPVAFLLLKNEPQIQHHPLIISNRRRILNLHNDFIQMMHATHHNGWESGVISSFGQA